MIYFITGQPGTGKTTSASRIKEEILNRDPDRKVFMLDGDVVRKMWPHLKYSQLDRAKSLSNVLALAIHFGGVLEGDVIISVVAPVTKLRYLFHHVFEPNILELRLDEVFEERNPEWYPEFEPDLPDLVEAHYYGIEGLEEILKKINHGDYDA